MGVFLGLGSRAVKPTTRVHLVPTIKYAWSCISSASYVFVVSFVVQHREVLTLFLSLIKDNFRQFRWPCGRSSPVDGLWGSQVRIPLGTWMFVSCVLSCVGRRL